MDLTKQLLSPSKNNNNAASAMAPSEANRVGLTEGSGAKIPGPAAALGLGH